MTRKAVIGVGNLLRGDDAAGLEVAARLRPSLAPTVEVIEHGGEPTSLIEAWSGADEVVIVDAISSGAAPGTLHRFEAGQRRLATAPASASSHGLGPAEAVELARALGRLPRQLTIHAIEGESFGLGEGLSPAVAGAVDRLVAALRAELAGRRTAG